MSSHLTRSTWLNLGAAGLVRDVRRMIYSLLDSHDRVVVETAHGVHNVGEAFLISAAKANSVPCLVWGVLNLKEGVPLRPVWLSAIQNGSLEAAKWAYGSDHSVFRSGTPGSIDDMDLCGRSYCGCRFTRHNGDFCSSICGKNSELVKWVYSLRTALYDSNEFDDAFTRCCYGGLVSVLEWMTTIHEVSTDMDWDWFSSDAFYGGHKNVLDWIEKQEPHFVRLDYLDNVHRMVDCDPDARAFLREAILDEVDGMVEEFTFKVFDSEWYRINITRAVARGNIKVLKFLFRDAPHDSSGDASDEDCKIASSQDRLEVLQFLIEHGRPLTQEACKVAGDRVGEWLHSGAIECPCGQSQSKRLKVDVEQD